MIELLIGLVVVGVGFLLAIGLPIVSLVRSARLARQIDELGRRLDRLAEHLRTSEHEASGPAAGAARHDLRRPTAHATSATAPPVPAASTNAETLAGPPASETIGPEVTAAPRVAPPDARTAPVGATPLSGATPPPAPAGPSFEARVGGRWLLYAAVATLLVGASFFLKYAFDNEWITPGLRVALGALAGLGCVGAGTRFAARGARFFGQVVVGGGIALLYLTSYATYHFYGLITREAAFLVMVGITALGAWVGDRQRAQALAMAALVGGFATPMLVGGTRDAQVTLFTYVTILVAGAIWLASRHRWSALPVVGFILTGLTFAAWATAHYTPAKWALTELFLTVLAGLFVVAWWHARRIGTSAGRAAAVVLATGPLAYHLASLANLAQAPTWTWLLVYLIAFSAAAVTLTVRAGHAWLRLASWAAVAVPLSVWAAEESGAAWVWPGLVTLGAIYGLHLLATWKSLPPAETRLGAADIVLIHGNGLWAYDAIDSLVRPVALDWLGPAAAVLALWHLALAGAASRLHRDAMLQWATLSFALAAIGVAVTFDGAGQATGWAALGAGLAWMGLGAGRTWMRLAGGGLGAMALLRLVEWHDQALAVGTWPLVNVRFGVTLFALALLYLVAWWHARADPRPPGARHVTAGLVVVASVLTVVALTSEIGLYFDLAAWQAADGGAGAITAGAARRQVAVSIAWAAYALLLVTVGLRTSYAPWRYFAIGLFVLTTGKVFFYDLAQVDRVYRIVSTLGLGVLLLVASWLYQQLVSRPSQPDQLNLP
ncbi:MAG: DUF2339 domain-containing protein [Acidobacteria bacterium]|nr:DUF2339 domain-containing protein [Acidobacteriota bacterium]